MQPVKQHDLLQQLQEASEIERQNILTDHIRAEVANVLGLPFSQIEVQQPLNNMGFDSLMAVELRNRVETELRTKIPLESFLEGLSISTLVKQVSQQLKEMPSILSESSTKPVSQIQGETHLEWIDLTQGIHPELAGRLLARLETLNDKKVDELLSVLLSEEEKQNYE